MAERDDSESEAYTKNTGTTSESEWVEALEIDVRENVEPLRPGDVILYTHPAVVAGSRNSSRVTQILSTDPDLGMPLSLRNGELLPADTYVRRIKEYKYGRLNDHDGISRPIENFRFDKRALSQKDESGLSGFQNQVERLSEMFLDTQEELKTLPQDVNTNVDDQMDAVDEPSSGILSNAAGAAPSPIRRSKSNAVVDAPSPSLVTQLEMQISSPLRNMIAGVQGRSVDPFFQEIITDEETGVCSVVYKEIGNLTAMVPVA